MLWNCNGFGDGLNVEEWPVMSLQINVPTDIDGMDLMAEKVDRKQLVDLLKHMLMLDQERRIKPDEALNHPFQTMSYLLDYVHCTTYVTDVYSAGILLFCVVYFDEGSNAADRIRK